MPDDLLGELAALTRARDALYALSSRDVTFEYWSRVCIAAKHAGLDEELVGLWFDCEEEWLVQRGAWETLRPPKVGADLLSLARCAGWYVDGTAEEVWARCKPAPHSHPYVVARPGLPEGLRMLPANDPIMLFGERMGGALVAPLMGRDGTVTNLQFIPQPCVAERALKKWKESAPLCSSVLNLSSTNAEGWLTVGRMSPGGVVFLCDNLNDAWACWEATRCASVVFGGDHGGGFWEECPVWATALRQSYATAHFILVSRDQLQFYREDGESDPIRLLNVHHAGYIDAAGVVEREGVNALRVLLSRVVELPAPEPRFKPLGAADIAALPPLPWRIRGVLPAQGLAGLYGASTAGKSFLALDMAAAVAEGRAWFGYEVKPAPVVYVWLEGEAGLKQRVAAWEEHNGRKLPAGLQIVFGPCKLTDAEDVTELIKALPEGAVVMIDTLNRAAPTADENSSRDMGSILEAVSVIRNAIRGLVVLVHHTGKDVSKGPRGHSSLYAALDAAIEVTSTGGRRAWEVVKAKDGAESKPHSFDLVVVPLADGADSCVVVSGEDERRYELPRVARAALRVLQSVIAIEGTTPPTGFKVRAQTPTPMKVLAEDRWRSAVYAEADADSTPEAKRKAFDRARSALIDAGLVAKNGELVWPL